MELCLPSTDTARKDSHLAELCSPSVGTTRVSPKPACDAQVPDDVRTVHRVRKGESTGAMSSHVIDPT